MYQEKYGLTWQNYSDHLKNMMKELMLDEDYADVTLVTEDKKQIRANISILRACSPVFKEILKKEKNLSPIIYLRGIQYSEMESVMQFIYLGEATFYQERMEEFLAVAESLEIKALCNSEGETNDEPKDQVPLPEKFEELKAPQSRERGVVIKKKGYVKQCDQCHKTFYDKSTLNKHRQSVHEGVRYVCDKCDYQASSQSYLADHIKSKHEGMKYACDKCDFVTSWKNGIRTHKKKNHEH